MDAEYSDRGAGLPTRIIKFGGTSVTGGDRIDTIADVVRDTSRTSRPVLVVSAFARVTTLLELAAEAARTGQHGEVCDRLFVIHEGAVKSMTDGSPILDATVGGLLSECRKALDQIADRSLLSGEARDEILSFGERLSCAIVTTALAERGVPAVGVDAASLVVTDSNFGDARADLSASRVRIQAMLPGAPSVPIVTGFLGATPSGARTSLGREGSDYSAAVLAWGLDAESVEIWTDVDGVMTADPRVVSTARPHRRLTYDELFELSLWGAKVVHPKTVHPLRERGIVLSIRNTLAPTDPGTRVGLSDGIVRSGPLGVACIDTGALLTGSAAGEAFGGVLREQDREKLRALLESGREYAVVTVVGDIGPSADDWKHGEPLSREGVTVHAVIAGKSRRSLSFVVDEEDGDRAVRTAHDAVVPAIAAHV